MTTTTKTTSTKATKAADKKLQANVEKVVAAVVARSAQQRLSNVSTIEWDTELSDREINEALRVACAQRRILFSISTALGITYFVD